MRFIATMRVVRYPVVEIEAENIVEATRLLDRDGPDGCDTKVLHQADYPDWEVRAIRDVKFED